MKVYQLYPTYLKQIILCIFQNESTQAKAASHDQASRLSVRTLYPITLSSEYLINPRSLCPQGVKVDYLIMVHR